MGVIADTLTGKRHRGTGRTGLPREARILKPSDFNKVFKKNVASSDRYFRIIARPGEQDPYCQGHRLGMAVSKKVDRTAVGRNRIKRVVRESFRHWRGQSDQGKGQACDFVVLARPASATICNQQLFSSLARHWPTLERQAMKKFGRSGLPEGQ